MTIEIKKPFEFKGNKTWYLHKLSEKGADAIKCNFPNGNNTYTKTTIQAAIEELAENGGGGSSTPSAQPDRVIIIDTTLTENIEGKAYSTFAAAKTYMEANPSLKFQVELPAGDFSEAISIDSHWVINGNNTNLTSPITTTDIVAQADIGQNSEYRIKNCTISGGFTSTATEEGTFSIFYLNNCELKNNSCSTTPVVILCNNCLIDSNEDSYCILIAAFSFVKKCKFILMNATHSIIAGELTIMQSPTPMPSSYFIHCIIMQNADIKGDSFFVNCQFSKGSKISRLELLNCVGDTTLSSDIASGDKCKIRQSHIYLSLGDGVSTLYVDLNSSTIYFKDTSFSTGRISLDSESAISVDNSTIPTLYASANSSILNNNSITTNYKPNLYMYSTDGGLTMSDDQTGATHVGTLKTPNTIFSSAATVTDYIWIPLS